MFLQLLRLRHDPHSLVASNLLKLDALNGATMVRLYSTARVMDSTVLAYHPLRAGNAKETSNEHQSTRIPDGCGVSGCGSCNA
jgi:hypothetical protein